MLVKTEGIVLNKFDYSDNSIIVKIYTRHYGLQTLMIRSAHRKKSTHKASLFQPLSILDLVFYHKENQEIKTLKETRLAHVYRSLQSHFLKASIAVFIAEILVKTIRETFPDERKYDFIKNSLLYFDLQEEGIANFHLSFLIKLSKYLGFYITEKEIENLPNKSFENQDSSSFKVKTCLVDKTVISKSILALSNQSYLSLQEIKLTNNQRRVLMKTLISHYQEYIENFGEIKSLEVFEQVFE